MALGVLGGYEKRYDPRVSGAVSTVTPGPQRVEGGGGDTAGDGELREGQQLAQDGAGTGIEGELEVHIETVFGVIGPWPRQGKALGLRLHLVHLDVRQPLIFRAVHIQPPAL